MTKDFLERIKELSSAAERVKEIVSENSFPSFAAALDEIEYFTAAFSAGLREMDKRIGKEMEEIFHTKQDFPVSTQKEGVE